MPIKRSTKEEIDKKLEDAEKEKNKGSETPNEETPDEEDEETEISEEENEEEEGSSEESENEEEEEEEKNEEEEEENEEGKQKPPVKKEPPIEERYKNSSQEAQILNSKNKKFTETVKKAAGLPEPTEEELKKEYPEWDVMDTTTKKLAKDSLMNKRKFDAIHGVVLEGEKFDTWVKKVDEFLVEGVTAYPALKGKEDQFRKFCRKESRHGVDFEVLANAFINIAGQEKPTRKKGSLLNTASGGRPSSEKKGDYIDEKEAARLRKTDQKTYNRLVREKKIKIEL